MESSRDMAPHRHSKLQSITIFGTVIATLSLVFTISLILCSRLGVHHPFEGNPGVFFLLVPLVPFSIVVALWGGVVLLKTFCSLRLRIFLLVLSTAGIISSLLLGYWILKLWMIGPINLH